RRCRGGPGGLRPLPAAAVTPCVQAGIRRPVAVPGRPDAALRRRRRRRPNRVRWRPRPLDLARCPRDGCVTLSVWAFMTAGAAAADPPPTYIPPVDAPISDPFRPPPTP